MGRWAGCVNRDTIHPCIYIYIYLDGKPNDKGAQKCWMRDSSRSPWRILRKDGSLGEKGFLSIAGLTRQHLAEILHESSHCVADW